MRERDAKTDRCILAMMLPPNPRRGGSQTRPLFDALTRSGAPA
jgi:hypothetical protein